MTWSSVIGVVLGKMKRRANDRAQCTRARTTASPLVSSSCPELGTPARVVRSKKVARAQTWHRPFGQRTASSKWRYNGGVRAHPCDQWRRAISSRSARGGFVFPTVMERKIRYWRRDVIKTTFASGVLFVFSLFDRDAASCSVRTAVPIAIIRNDLFVLAGCLRVFVPLIIFVVSSSRISRSITLRNWRAHTQTTFFVSTAR